MRELTFKDCSEAHGGGWQIFLTLETMAFTLGGAVSCCEPPNINPTFYQMMRSVMITGSVLAAATAMISWPLILIDEKGYEPVRL